MSTFRCFVLNLITDEFHLSGEQFLILIYVQIITQSAFTARCIVALGSRVLDSSSSSPTGSQAQARGQRRRRFDAFQWSHDASFQREERRDVSTFPHCDESIAYFLEELEAVVLFSLFSFKLLEHRLFQVASTTLLLNEIAAIGKVRKRKQTQRISFPFFYFNKKLSSQITRKQDVHVLVF